MRSQRGIRRKRRRLVAGLAAVACAAVAVGVVLAVASPSSSTGASSELPSSSPIKHVVVIFQENESFDHYFGTYPNAANPPGEPPFAAAPGTPSVNGLTPLLLTANPNSANPRRLDRTEAVTCSQNHGYGAEQEAFDHGLMDLFPEKTAGGGCTDKTLVMGYYDGNTVTGLWNYAQHFSLNDNSFDTQFGPSTVGALNLISGETGGASAASGVENGTVVGDPDPAFDDCGHGGSALSGKNVGDLMNEKGITWGWFQGGFRPTATVAGKAVCGSTHQNVAGATITDYVPHHEPFEYYASTSNPHHLPPTSVAMIGHTDQANHQYDIADFDAALAAGNLPSVSYLKAPAYENGHPGNSDPLDEQRFLAQKINAIAESPYWSSTAVVIAYDDSDGWYDHVMPTIVNPSKSKSDSVSGPEECGHVPSGSTAPSNRCGYGPRLPLLVISPYARQNYVDSSQTDQTSILQFIEDNWGLGRIGGSSSDAKAGSMANMFDFSPAAAAPAVLLDPETGVVTRVGSAPPATPPATPPARGPAPAAPKPPVTIPPTKGSRPHTKVSCEVDGDDHDVALDCRVSGGGSGGAVRFRLKHGGHTYGTSRAAIRGNRAKARIHSRHDLSGGFSLVATVSRREGVTALSHSVSLPGRSRVNLR